MSYSRGMGIGCQGIVVRNSEKGEGEWKWDGGGARGRKNWKKDEIGGEMKINDEKYRLRNDYGEKIMGEDRRKWDKGSDRGLWREKIFEPTPNPRLSTTRLPTPTNS